MFSLKRFKYLLRRTLRALGKATGTAHQIGMGVAIGFFVGWLPIMGIQMAVAVVICAIFKANKLVPLFPIWLTNPVTAVPIYSFNYWVGWKIVGGPPLIDLVVIMRKMVTPPDPVPGMGRFEVWWDGVKHACGELLSMGWNMQLPLWLGCVVVGLALAIPSYYLSCKFVESFRKAVNRKRVNREKRRRARGMDVSMGGGYSQGTWIDEPGNKMK